MNWLYIGGVILIIVGIAAYFMGKKGAGGMTPERGQMFLAVGVILGIILVLAATFMGE
jgi:hypothetical protein